MDSKQIAQLKLHVEKTLGRKILSSSDCHHLHNDIARQMPLSISFNTLRRFFNLMKAKHEQSVYTLNILAMYCGFASYDAFVNWSKQQSIDGSSEVHENEELLNYLVLLFKNMQVTGPNDFTYNHLVRETIIFLQQHPLLIDRFQRAIARTKNGQDYYFEQFINMDNLHTYYGDGLRYYLQVKRTTYSQVFGNYLLCFRFWLVMDSKQLNKHYQLVMEHEMEKKESPSCLGFYFATQLYHADDAGEGTESIVVRARQVSLAFIVSKDHQHEAVMLYYVLAQALTLIGEYDEALFYLRELLKVKKKYPVFSNDAGFWEMVTLLKGIALAQSGEKEDAREALDEVDLTNCHFLSKQYMTMLYLKLRLLLKKNASDQQQLEYLVNATGFTRLASSKCRMAD